MTYPVPGGPVDREIEINKSRFIAWLRPVRSREEGQGVLDEARARYPDATHHCHAWLIGAPNSGHGAMNDDGEPSGTAGKPIFNVIQHKGVGDVMVVVIRYFGGVKLGAGGLVRAYAGAAEAVLSAMEVVEQVPESAFTLTLGFADEQPLRHWCDQNGARLEAVDYGQAVTARLTVADATEPALRAFCAAQGIIVEGPSAA
ncbi:IMPACT family protein [Alloalcanivorax sp. C16-2]|uniref:IMPACT family protein n=1 Tax=Alloalcanivorax sp. C16-2 TaxID=3390052 RepID=UPI003970BB6A